MRRRLVAAGAALVIASAALAIAGCGGSGSSKTTIEVAAASSLQLPLEAYAKTLKTIQPSYSFNGSGAIALQIEQGVKPDVFASANPQLPEYLYEKKLVEKPIVFAANRIVIAVPADSPIDSVSDVATKGVSVAIAGEGVPVGVYAHAAIGKLPAAEGHAILANVRDTEADDTGIVGKLTAGAIDAGFVYATDVLSSNGVLRAVELPAGAQLSTAYSAAVVVGAKHPAQARAFIQGLVSGTGRGVLHRAGFLEPPPG